MPLSKLKEKQFTLSSIAIYRGGGNVAKNRFQSISTGGIALKVSAQAKGCRESIVSVIHDRHAAHLLIRYSTIGVIVAVIDISILKTALVIGAPIAAATTVGYFVGVSSHFALNRYFNFKDNSRSTFQQAQTYSAVVFFSWILTLLIIYSGTRSGLSPVQSKIISIVVNLPVGFLSHRYLTFGGGIVARIRRLLRPESN